MNDYTNARIGFVGAGKVGVSLGKYLLTKGLNVIGYFSKTSESTQEAATYTGTSPYYELGSLVQDCNVSILTVTDRHLLHVWNQLKTYQISGKIFCHCSGAMSSLVFSDLSKLYAYGYSIHPLCAIPNKKNSEKLYDSITFTIEGSAEHLETISNMLRGFGNKVISIQTADKAKYHAAAVISSNLVVGLYQTACNLLEECGFTSEEASHSLSRLFYGNCQSIVDKGTYNALTGPLERQDFSTIEKHLSVLEGNQLELYRLLSLELLPICLKKHPEYMVDEAISLLQREDDL